MVKRRVYPARDPLTGRFVKKHTYLELAQAPTEHLVPETVNYPASFVRRWGNFARGLKKFAGYIPYVGAAIGAIEGGVTAIKYLQRQKELRRRRKSVVVRRVVGLSVRLSPRKPLPWL